MEKPKNQIIAEYLGCYCYPDHIDECRVVVEVEDLWLANYATDHGTPQSPSNPRTNVAKAYIHQLPFHSDWNLLMYVWHKILTGGIENPPMFKSISEQILLVDIRGAYNGIVNLIAGNNN